MTTTGAWVGRQIKTARERRGWSQGELARRLDRTQTAISYWERGKRTPDLEELVRLAGVLGEDVSFFLPGSRPVEQPLRAVLRATAQRLEGVALDRALDGLVDAAEADPPPPAELAINAASGAVPAARELLKKAQVTAPPVDVERLSERCGVRVVRCAFPEDLSGAVIELDEGAVIGVNLDHGVSRQRFTIGHELGHYLLGHHEQFHIDLGPSGEHGHPPGYDWRSERSANDFAAELLMPVELVLREHERTRGFGLAERFQVSHLAMSYRLVDLGLR